MKKKYVLSIVLVLLPLLSWLYLANINNYQLDGEIVITSLNKPVTVHRDQYGIPYIFADNTPDLIRAQGFVVAQDRIFQVELYRALISGNLASLIGESGLASDIKMRVVGIQANAQRHLAYLNEDSQSYLRWYVEGYNEFLKTRQDEFPVELSLLGIEPKPLTLADLLAVQHYAGFVHSKNYEDEILSLNLASVLGAEKAKSLLPLNINLDRRQAILKTNSHVPNDGENVSGQYQLSPHRLTSLLPMSLPASGSNNWVTASLKSVGNRPILSNDPHLDARILPGPWFPVGLFTPEIKAVGATLPGLPGLLVGRTDYVAFGVTNAYGDSQDLYIEEGYDAGHYMDSGKQVPYQVTTDTITVKDASAKSGFREHILRIRRTKRGPVISDHDVFELASEQPIVLRWAIAELTGTTLGSPQFLTARNIMGVDKAVQDIDLLYLNFVFADVNDGIGHRASGLVPIRQAGAVAKNVTVIDDWQGFIPKNEMPGQMNPDKGWLGTSNQDVVPDNYPYYYSTHFSPYYRYQRTREMMTVSQELAADDHWNLILDVKNKHAERLTPIFIAALANDNRTNDLADGLIPWDYRDAKGSIAATIFHLTHEHLVRLILADDLPDGLLEKYLGSRYYWLQRIDDWIVSGDSEWFDISNTPSKETLTELIVQAGVLAKSSLNKKMGNDQSKWRWGEFHTLSFMSPIRRDGIGRDLLGAGTHPVPGSGETLNRGQYRLNGGPYVSEWFSSMRMVADMNDNDKVMAVVSGGNVARQFHPNFKSQVTPWLEEAWLPWWRDKEKIKQHSAYKLKLLPN